MKDAVGAKISAFVSRRELMLEPDANNPSIITHNVSTRPGSVSTILSRISR